MNGYLLASLILATFLLTINWLARAEYLYVKVLSKRGDAHYFYFPIARKDEVTKALTLIDRVWKKEGSGFVQFDKFFFDIAEISVYEVKTRKVTPARMFFYDNRIF